MAYVLLIFWDITKFVICGLGIKINLVAGEILFEEVSVGMKNVTKLECFTL